MRPPCDRVRLPNSVVLFAAFVLAGVVPGCGRDDAPAPSVSVTRTSTSVPTPPVTPVAPVAPRTPPPEVLPAGATSRWYEVLTDGGKKSGWYHVVWSKSTWNGHETVLDVTTNHSRRTRRMLTVEDVFESTSEQRTERGLDGALYRMVARSTDKSGRVVTSETTWTGTGYDAVERVEAREPDASEGTKGSDATEQRHHADATAPAHVDAEAMLSARIAAGTLKVGDRFVRRELNLAAKRVDEKPLVVAADEEIDVPTGRVRAWKIVESDPRTGGETFFWIDREGAVARLKDLAAEVRRVGSRADAERRWGAEATFTITAAAHPPLPRIFSAERLELDVGISPDANRPRPEFPDSPFGRTVSVTGDDKAGFVVRMELRAHDAKDAHATIPVKDPAFAKDLESTLQMPCEHPDVKGAAYRAVAGETDARKAAVRIAAFVFTLAKEPPDEAGPTALDILREHKGYCAEHALLFVALCRAAGIPARRCSGYVCIGDDWGSHAWAEIWVGKWMGVDPTTNDVGTAARYLFFGYSDDPESHAGTVSARALERLSFESRSLDEGTDHVDLTDAKAFQRFDADKRTAFDRLSGFEARDLPEGFDVTFGREGSVSMRGPGGASVEVHIQPDQGYRPPPRPDKAAAAAATAAGGTFAGKFARVRHMRTTRVFIVNTRKRNIMLTFNATRDAMDELVATMERAMAPTFSDLVAAPK